MTEEEKEFFEERFQALQSTIEGLLTATEGTKTIDHKGVAMVASEGLRGGGTIDKSRPFALDFKGLTQKTLKKPNEEFLAFFHMEEGEHFRTDIIDLVNTVVRLSGFVEAFIDVRKQVQELREKIELFTIYERLYKAEELIALLAQKEKVRQEKEESDAEREQN